MQIESEKEEEDLEVEEKIGSKKFTFNKKGRGGN